MAEKTLRTLTGKVVSRSDKSVVVKVIRRVKHPLYRKYLSVWTKIHAHDAENNCQVGDRVAIKQCRPLSKTKSWTLVDIIEKAA